MSDQSTPCPCGSGASYAECCGRYHAGMSAPTAAALMRSRYSAYVLGNLDYLRATWHPDTCPADLDADPALRWIGLDIRACERGTEGDSDGTVEFVARYKVNGRAGRLHEVSRFVQEQGRWRYVDGDIAPEPEPRRKGKR